MRAPLVLVAALASWAAGAVPAARAPARPVRDSVRLERAWPVMGTLFRAVARAPDSTTAVSALLAARDEVRRLDSLLSDYRDDSEVSRLARRAGTGRWTTLSRETATLLRASLRWAEATGGAFDPTVGPMVRAWGFRGPSPRVPSPVRRDSALGLVGWWRVETRAGGREARLPRRGMALDFGAIGKGFALDRAVAAMRERGAEAGMLDLGGNVLVFGHGPGPRGGWPIGIRNPRCPERVLGMVVLDSGSVATSGDYERFFEEGGVRYGHILDPRTGRPSRGVLQVTVAAPDGLAADALSTALFVMGPGAGRRLLRREPAARGAGALWVTGRGAASGPSGPTGRPAGVVLAGKGARRFDLGRETPDPTSSSSPGEPREGDGRLRDPGDECGVQGTGTRTADGGVMNEVLRKQIWRKLEGLPDEKGYQILDYIQFLESEYAEGSAEASGFQRFGELLQDRMRKRRVPAAALRETMRVLGGADRVLGAFKEAAGEFLAELEAGRPEPAPKARTDEEPPRPREVVIE